jgi:hypothetical protein
MRNAEEAMRDKIIALARESGFNDPDCRSNLWLASLERFYQLAVADAITAADKRIAELEALLDKTQRECIDRGSKLIYANHNLAVAREALERYAEYDYAGHSIAREALAQIGEK